MIDKFGNVERRKAGDVMTETEAELINDILFLYKWNTLHTINKTDSFDKLMFAPVTDEEVKRFEEYYKILKEEGKALKTSKDFTDKLYGRIHEETGVNMKPTRLDRVKSWWLTVTTGEKAYLSFWIIWLYLLLGLVITQEPRIVGMVCEIILWPFFM